VKFAPGEQLSTVSRGRVRRGASLKTPGYVEKSMSGTEETRMEGFHLVGSNERKGAVMMTVGKLLLWTDLIFLSFVYSGLKGGSYLYSCWTVLQGTAGLTMLIVGRIQRGPWAE
jgi:hypothetical protein